MRAVSMTTPTMTRLDAYRQRRDHYFANDHDSPLEASDRRHFAGLCYFPESPALAFEVTIDDEAPDIGEQIDLLTVDGQTKPFVRAGRIHLPIGNQEVTLSVFKDPARGRYFLPFRDGTSGKETYAGGRYLDPRARPDGTLLVDFNFAYNPYCAYSKGWSCCPIPPSENVTSVRIEAGEQLPFSEPHPDHH
jgi:uncharacterized protein (DUF1684 family)